MLKNEFTFEQAKVKTSFSKNGNPFPESVETYGITNLLQSEIVMTLEDGREYRPFIADWADTALYPVEGGKRLEFRNMLWKNEKGEILPDFILSLRYEFHDIGATFVNAFFTSETCCAPGIRSFRLTHALDLESFSDVKWEHCGRIPSLNPTEVMLMQPKRFISSGEPVEYDNLFSHVAFNCYEPGRCLYAEFFMEGAGSVQGSSGNTASSVRWNGKSPALEWEFQKTGGKMIDRPWQWRNQWGWIITPPPSVRRLPPQRMFHFIDNTLRYPSNRQIEKMAANGADVLIIHEIWRNDMQNGGTPRNTSEFRRVADCVHAHGMRLALYVRGNEKSISQERANWFGSLLTRDWDGLYMDYGSPKAEIDPPGEFNPGGSYSYYRHLMKLYDLRKRVGRGGIIYSHMGSIFSALGLAGGLVDMYVSGEAEGGRMTRSRLEHEYFSGSLACAGSMWTAAFPEYGTAKMTPFLAAAGQSPHVTIGTQFISSSLSHSSEPGLACKHLRPLWKLWGLFRNRRDIRIFNSLNSSVRDGSLMCCGDSALLIIANFENKTRIVSQSADWDMTGIAPRKILCFNPAEDSPGAPFEVKNCEAELLPYGVAGFLINGEDFSEEITEFKKPYPLADAADMEWLDKIKKQKDLRDGGTKNLSSVWIKIAVPSLALSFEDSLWLDLYDNAFQLGYFSEAETFAPLSWIDINGLTPRRPEKRNYILPGHESVWMEISEFKYEKMGIRSMRGETTFYSFIEVMFSDCPHETENSYSLRFFNELEKDRALITWQNKHF